MKISVLENMIRRVVREEIDYALKREIKELKESAQHTPILDSSPKNYTSTKTKTNKKKKLPIQEYTKNQALNSLLNETAEDIQNGTSQSVGNGEAPASLETPFMSSQPIPTEILPEHIQSAVTRDYSSLMKAIDEKKGR